MNPFDCLAIPMETPIVVATAISAWTLGDFVEIVPADTIIKPFDLHYFGIEDLDDDTLYEIVIYAVENEIARIRVAKRASPDMVVFPLCAPIVAANSQIQVRALSAIGNSIVTLGRILYHEYWGDEGDHRPRE